MLKQNTGQYQTAELQALDARHHIHPFTNTREINAKGSMIITRADGVYIYDSDDREYIDAMSGLWCVNIGYGRHELADIAKEQMQQLPYYNSFFQTSQLPAVELAELLAEVTPEHINRVFFTCSGSEANDTNIRLVRYYWELLGQPERKVIISRVNGYHGSTVGGASLGGMSAMHAQGGLPIPDIEHIGQPFWYQEGGDLSKADFGLKAAQELETRILEIGADKVAAFIGEPVQGAGGVIVPPETYWPEIQRICDKYDILLIADEVICGFGRTGNWFGSQTFGIKPDLMPIAKGLSSGYMPIGGVMIADRVAKVLEDKGGEFNHGYTYSGHPVACAVAKRNIEIIRDEKMVENGAAVTAPYLQAKIAEMADHPLVGEARGVGFLGGFQLVADKATRRAFDEDKNVGATCRNFCYENGLIMRAVGDSMIMCPPLITSNEEIDIIFDRARKAFDATYQALS